MPCLCFRLCQGYWRSESHSQSAEISHTGHLAKQHATNLIQQHRFGPLPRVSARQLSETPDQNLDETEKPRWPRTRETKPTRRDRCEVRQRSTLGRANPLLDPISVRSSMCPAEQMSLCPYQIPSPRFSLRDWRKRFVLRRSTSYLNQPAYRTN